LYTEEEVSRITKEFEDGQKALAEKRLAEKASETGMPARRLEENLALSKPKRIIKVVW